MTDDEVSDYEVSDTFERGVWGSYEVFDTLRTTEFSTS